MSFTPFLRSSKVLAALKRGEDLGHMFLRTHTGTDIANAMLKAPGEKVQWAHPHLRETNQKVKGNGERRAIPIMRMALPTSVRSSLRPVAR